MIGSILALIYSDGVDQSASLLTTIIELTAFAIIKIAYEILHTLVFAIIIAVCHL